MPAASLIRVLHFRARHHYVRADRSESWNEARFGEQRRPHEHEFRLEITITGPLDPETGFVVDLATLDAVLHDVIRPLTGADLNEAIPEVESGRMQPSTEALAGWFLNRFAERIPAPARVRGVRLWESADLGAEAWTAPDPR